jgi:hypothetical protein
MIRTAVTVSTTGSTTIATMDTKLRPTMLLRLTLLPLQLTLLPLQLTLLLSQLTRRIIPSTRKLLQLNFNTFFVIISIFQQKNVVR